MSNDKVQATYAPGGPLKPAFVVFDAVPVDLLGAIVAGAGAAAAELGYEIIIGGPRRTVQYRDTRDRR